MGITARDTGGGQDFDPVAQGMHHAICYGVYDLGHQHSELFGKTQHKVLIQWELPNERIDVERENGSENLPRAISKIYTLSLNEKAILRQHLETWRGKAFTGKELDGFDITKLLGVNCMVQVIHKKKDSKTYANVTSIVPFTGDKALPENEPRYFSFEEKTPIPSSTPNWVIEMIHSAKEWNNDTSIDLDNDSPPLQNDNDIPF